MDSPGDNLLAEFASVVDAVQCAVAVQKELQARNAELPENRRMLFRIGVNLGDVIEEGDRIYGDGVNIAARLESIADPGGICVSKTAFDQIETKLPFGYAYLGEQTVKNITKPVGAYRSPHGAESDRRREVRGSRRQSIRRRVAFIGLGCRSGDGCRRWHSGRFSCNRYSAACSAVEKADPKQMALPLPEQPSIAVLPFVNLSEDPKQQLLCDGHHRQHHQRSLQGATAASSSPAIRPSPYKGKTVKAKRVSEELGRTVRDGGQRSAVRGPSSEFTAEWSMPSRGSQLLSERFDGETADLFNMQDDITFKVLRAIHVQLGGVAISSRYYRGTHGLDCFLKLQEALGHPCNASPSRTPARPSKFAEEGLADVSRDSDLPSSLGPCKHELLFVRHFQVTARVYRQS